MLTPSDSFSTMPTSARTRGHIRKASAKVSASENRTLARARWSKTLLLLQIPRRRDKYESPCSYKHAGGLFVVAKKEIVRRRTFRLFLCKSLIMRGLFYTT